MHIKKIISCIISVLLIIICPCTSVSALSYDDCDVTADGRVNILDYLVLSYYLTGSLGDDIVLKMNPDFYASADFNSDNIINSIDMTIFKKVFMQLPSDNNGTSTDNNSVNVPGIDVSNWQGDIDWQAVADSGVKFVMIKAGEGLSVNSCFEKNINGAKNAGLMCGVYWFSNAADSEQAKAEALACHAVISKYQLEYPVAYDYEYRSENYCPEEFLNDPQYKTDIVSAFLSAMEDLGYYASVYANYDYLKHHFNADELLLRYDLWYANYGEEVPSYKCGMFQYTSKGSVNGISADVDLNTAFRDYPAIMKKYHFNGF